MGSVCVPLLGASLDPIPDLTLDEDAPPREIRLTFDPAPLPASAYRFSASSDNPALLPPGALRVLGRVPHPVLSVLPAPDASGEAWVTVEALSDRAETVSQRFRLEVLPVDDPPRIEPIPNQVLVEGMPTVRVPVRASDPDGALRVTTTASDGSRNLRLGLAGTGDRRMLEMTPIGPALTSPAQVSVTLTAISGRAQSSIQFYVVIKPRDFSTTGSAFPVRPPSVPITLPPLPSSRLARFVWADIGADGYPDLTSYGLSGVRWGSPQGGESVFIPIGRGPTQSGLTAVAWADLDGDGGLEAFASGAGAFGIYRRSRPGVRSPLVVTHADVLIPMTVEGAAWADLDGNGSLDLAYSGVTNEVQAVVLALNDGLGNLTVVSHSLPPASGPVVAADFDQDGRMDLLLCNVSPGGTPAQIHFNRGVATFGSGPVVADDHPVTGAGVVDADGDGVPDLWLVQAVNGNRRTLELNVFLQRAGRFTRSFHLDAHEFATAAEPAWGDLDHDGRADFVAPYRDRALTANREEVSTNYFAIYHNQGDGRFARGDFLFRAPVEVPGALPSFVPAVADVDRDGDLDVIGHESGYRVFYNQEWEPNVPPNAPSGLHSLILGDEVFLLWSSSLDFNQMAKLTYNVRAGTAPGTNDLVASHSLASGVRQIPAPGNAGFLQSYSFRLPRKDLSRIYWTVQAVDASYSGGPFAAEQTIEVQFPENQPPSIEAPSELTLLEDTPLTLNIGVSDDWTPAEVLDVRARLNPEGLLSASWLLSPDGGGTSAIRRLRLNPKLNSSGLVTVTLTAADRNGATTTNEIRVLIVADNDQPVITANLLVFAARGRPIHGLLTVGDAESAPEDLRVSAVSSHPEFLPDGAIVITGSGNERELMATPLTDAPGSAEITLTVTDADGLSGSLAVVLRWQEQLLESEPLGENLPSMTEALVADVDGDGLLDVVGADAAVPGVVAVWRRTPAGGWVEGSRFVTGLLAGPLLSGDFDLDGDPDFVVRAVPGSVGTGGLSAVFLWNDGGRLERSTSLLVGVAAAKLVAMDADSDGDLDLVAGIDGSDLRLWRHPGGIPGPDAPQHWEPFPLERPQVLLQGLQTDSFLEALLATDLDDDGRMDLLLSRTSQPASTRGFVLRQNASGLFAAERPPWAPDAIPLEVTDFDNDGVTDPLVRFPLETAAITRVFAGRSRWVDIGYPASPGALGDLDGDGAEDLLVVASGTNDHGGLLSALTAEAPIFRPQNILDLRPDSLIPADLDGDGRLDVFALQEWRPVLVRNFGAPSNRPPAAPSALRLSRVASDEVELEWTAPQDAEQPGGLSYNVRVGTQPGSNDVVSALASSTGRARVPGRGNAGWRGRFRLRGLEVGRGYYWSVQAVDSGHARSGFAPEVSFTLTALPEISAIADLQLPISAGSRSVAFTVTDRETPASALQVAVSSSNPVLLPDSRLSLSGTGSERVLQLNPKPDRAGTAEMTLRVTDGEQLFVERRFTVYVPSGEGHAVTTDRTAEVAAGDTVELALDGFDPEGDFQSYTLSVAPRHGTVGGEGRRITYRAEPGFVGTDSLEFLATTPGSWPARGRITFRVEPPYRFRPEGRLAPFGIPARWQLVFRGRAGARVALEQSRDLRTWESLGEHLIPSHEVLSVTPPDLGDGAPRFFRLVRRDE